MTAGGTRHEGLRPYVELARIDHWFKNIFIVPGIAAALLLEPSTRNPSNAFGTFIAILSACLVASSNYVLNEILDAGTDRHHPSKKNRPVVAGRVRLPFAYAEWALLGAAGLLLGALVSTPLLVSLLALWTMGLIYNVPPIRTKEVLYLDVLSEAINNPIRLLLGWYAVGGSVLPPSSFLLAYWLIGAYLMAAKRFAEYRSIGDPERAARYRSSFRYYTEERLATAMMAYASGFMFFVGVILVKYHVEYIIACPLLMIYLGYYTHLAYQEESVAQNPEKLYRDPLLMFLTILIVVTISVLSVLHLPSLERWLGIAVRGW
ncbi:MAG TPA: UbiA prenyltransferase family protein [Candidatus Polarisedimenticolia bacterium]|jgi:4-hydroxybenzoate polyprenyltransferase|nr:UbiA prenyltransferase family protein [Candidatus Polarisedimenticolia bacterium]